MRAIRPEKLFQIIISPGEIRYRIAGKESWPVTAGDLTEVRQRLCKCPGSSLVSRHRAHESPEVPPHRQCLALALQIVLWPVWGISMLCFAPVIVLEDSSGRHIEKIAMEGGAHLMLVLTALLVWRTPLQSRDVLRLMIFLNGVWELTDLVYILLVHLTALDFYVKLAVNTALAVGLGVAKRRAGIL